MNTSIAIMVILLCLGGIANQVQILHSKKRFLTPAQFNLISFVGFMCFLMGVFIAIKALFPNL